MVDMAPLLDGQARHFVDNYFDLIVTLSRLRDAAHFMFYSASKLRGQGARRPYFLLGQGT